VIDERLVAEFTATFSPHLAKRQATPPGVFWCLAPDLVASEAFGPDGNPRLGLFLPQLPLTRRMWAGGELEFFGEFAAGDAVVKRSTIASITSKQGKTGALCFVTLHNEYRARGELIIRERHDIVYREPAPATAAPAIPPPSAYIPPAGRWTIDATPTLLFRYSAMTFNGHRIHYDYPYATGVEGYAGLVVHGPLQATLLLNRAADVLGRLPRLFSYRGLSPLICGNPFHVVAEENVGGGCAAKIVAFDGTATMAGTAS
jgi:3-methylfumaryl-CoA hydratase